MADQALTVVKSEPLPTLTVADAPARSQFPRDAQGRLAVGGSEDAPSDSATMLGPLAHPQTFTDFARLLSLPVDEVRKAAGAALALQAGKDTASAVKSGVGSVVDAVKDAASRVEVHPSAALDFKVTQPLKFLKKAVTLTAPVDEGAVSVPGYPRSTVTPPPAPAMPTPAPVTAAPPVAVAPPPAAAAPPPVSAPPAAAAAPFNPVLPSGTPSTAVAPKVLNELAIEARRAKLTLAGPDYQAGAELVTQGATPAQAVAQIAQSRSVAAPAASAAAKVTLTAEETKLGAQLVKKGASPPQALQTILQMRSLKGSVSTADATASVAARNASGHWPGED